MGLWDKLWGELVDIVEWLDNTHDTLVYRFQRYQNQIKYGAQLIVREGQTAVFVNQGQIADLFGPGQYTLVTQNLPLFSTLAGWKHGFNSPFKAEVYFVSTRQFTDLKWGTMNPVMLRDAEFGPIRLRAYGSYAIRAKDAGVLIRQIVGTDGRFSVGQISDQLRDLIVARFGDLLGESKIPALDLAGNYNELGQFITAKLQVEFAGYGLELAKFLVENISVPPEVEAALDKRTSMGVLGDLHRFTQYQTGKAMEDAAKNPGGSAGGGLGLGMGMVMAGQVGAAMAPGQTGGGVAPPPVPGAPAAAVFFVAVGGQSTGPFDLGTLEAQARAGRLTPETLIWKQGMAQWAPAGQVAELAALLGQVPPPVPPR